MGKVSSSETELSERQRREREYHERFSRRLESYEVNFEPVLGKERRPWNSYWLVHELARDNLRQSRQRLLDFGCGIGVVSIRLAKIGYEVYGFDVSPHNISIARDLATKYGLAERTSFSIQTAERLDYPDEFFDIVIGIDILHHVEIKPAVKECRRVLRKDGLAIFREHIESPLLDDFRNTRLCRMILPKDVSLERYITADERKLNEVDVSVVREIFPNLVMRRFLFLSRIDHFGGRLEKPGPSFWEKLDYVTLRSIPFLGRFGGGVVLIARKD